MSRPPAVQAPGLIKLSWLVRLHWAAILGQTALVVGVHLWLVPLPLLALLGLVAVEALANLALGAWLARAPHVSDAALAAVMLFDSLLLAALLHLSGGHFNPFSALFLVNVALAAILLPPRWSWAQLAFSLAAFGALFPLQVLAPFRVHEHQAMMTLHLQGMWVALALAAVLIVTIVQRVTRALGAREAELERARSLGERREKLASLATLAAGAAHELATPLGTIAVVAKELERSLQRSGATAEAQADLALIRAQVVRCRDILQQMAAQAGENAGEPLVPVPAAEWVAAALDGLPERERVEPAEPPGPSCVVRGPPRGLARALKALLRNALEASPPDRPVRVRARLSGREVLLEVADGGAGMSPEVLARAGEPFFSTKGPGAGTGLGLFLARALVEQLGGRLTLESVPGRGTTARIALPAAEVGS